MDSKQEKKIEYQEVEVQELQPKETKKKQPKKMNEKEKIVTLLKENEDIDSKLKEVSHETTNKVKNISVKVKTDYIFLENYNNLIEYLKDILPLYDNLSCKSAIKETIDVLTKQETNAIFFNEIQKLVECRKDAYNTLLFSTSEINPKREGYFNEDRKNLFNDQNIMLHFNKDILDKNNYVSKLEMKNFIEDKKFENLDGVYVMKKEFITIDTSEYSELVKLISKEVINKINLYNYLSCLLFMINLSILKDYDSSDIVNYPGLKQQKDKIVSMYSDKQTNIKRKTKLSEKPKKPLLKTENYENFEKLAFDE